MQQSLVSVKKKMFEVLQRLKDLDTTVLKQFIK